MWRTILLIQRYSTVARTVGIPNPNRPLLSGAGYKRNCACWQIASFYFCLRSTAHNPALKISTVSVRVLQSPHHNVLHEVGRHIVVCLATPDSGRAPLKFETVSALCSSDNFCARIA